ncbi:lytic murein transglycosylase B [Snodgrassella alvi]|uniref:lytic murein transglycosylase B n=1 Tax=Snodgrassella alvi TaxID=1196083 RepID=UPI0009FE8B5E|nr:lytic murein transglycosylase B [Snodgrassella alvi]ORF31588.1 lytic murein transglycosylase B [Snodgrassella alvi]ORF36144.1 lytic murein transglycosylase B [Snodgrassella alvi]ORF39580.1 lytic murein transglycosylase B [Snodgrassella alvi]ORF40434.1 lytic murein transglycosylase B [Snodgrassella alvi]
MMKLVRMISAALFLSACQSTHPIQEKPLQPTATTSVSSPADNKVFALTDSGIDLLKRNDVNRFIDFEVKRGQYSRAQLENFFRQVSYRPSIVRGMDKPGTSLPWYTFVQNNANNVRINTGNIFWKNNTGIIQSVSKRYGVAPQLLVAIVGIETNYGNTMGSYRVADALTTLGYHYPRRAEYFQRELSEFLQLAYEERQDPLSFKGSFAGAMGMPQFMPSSFRQFAVDWDGDGHRDIWRNSGDTLASVANYMKQHGWQSGAPIAVPVNMQPTPRLQQIIDEPTSLKYTAGQLRQLGVVIPAQIKDQEKGILYRLERSPGEYDYWFGLNNFYTIWQYNHSRHYVAAVRQIANNLADANANL